MMPLDRRQIHAAIIANNLEENTLIVVLSFSDIYWIPVSGIKFLVLI
jgi:hypothetical protein